MKMDARGLVWLLGVMNVMFIVYLAVASIFGAAWGWIALAMVILYYQTLYQIFPDN